MGDERRVALLITGQFRAVEGVSSSLEKFSGIDRSMFVSTWRNKGLKRAGWISTKQVEVLLGPAIANAFPPDLYGECSGILELLPAFKASLQHRIDTLGEVDPALMHQIGAVDYDIEDDDLYLGASVEDAFNEERLLYKTRRAISLMERYERARGIRFTHVMRLRPDALVLDETLSAKLDGRLYFDWRGLGGEDGRRVERVGDNIVLGPRDTVVTLITRSLRTVRRRRLVDGERSDIHQVLAEDAAAFSLETGDVRMQFCSGEWPAEDFLAAVAEKAAESKEHTMLLGFYHHARADQALEQGHFQLTLDRLEQVPTDRRAKMNHLRIAALAHRGLGHAEAALDAARRFRAEWEASHPSVQENMYSLLSDLQPILPL